jgi:tRNA A-37 threonylcarbamoyl transferase component Bud32
MLQKERPGTTTTTAGRASVPVDRPAAAVDGSRPSTGPGDPGDGTGSSPGPARPTGATRTVRSEYLERTSAWRQFHERLLPGAEVVAVSCHDGERRVFRDGREIVKVYRHTPAAARKLGAGLAREHEIATHLAHRVRAHVAATTHEVIDDEWEVLRIPIIDGETVDRLLSTGRGRQVSLLRALATIVRTNLAGVAHGDVNVGNFIVGPDGRVHLIDWGRAERASRLKALAGDVLGIGPNYTGYGGFRVIARSVLLARSSPTGPFARFYARRWRTRVDRGERRNVVDHKGWFDNDIEGLVDLGDVWELAAGDRADSTVSEAWGFELVGLKGRGHRSWETTWEWIRPLVRWTGRQILDLGPDAGFAATFARLEGAASATVLAPFDNRVAAAVALARCFEVDGVGAQAVEPFEPAVATELRSGADLVISLGNTTATWLDSAAHLLLTSDAHELVVELPAERARSIAELWQHQGRKVTTIAVPDDATAILHARWRVGV